MISNEEEQNSLNLLEHNQIFHLVEHKQMKILIECISLYLSDIHGICAACNQALRPHILYVCPAGPN